jgi:membrane-associated protease RseP (regulator of RpoE activity)
VAAVFTVENITTGLGDGRHIRLQGRLLVDSDLAYDRIAACFGPHGYTPLLREQDGQVTIVAVPGLFAARARLEPRALVLFALTVASVLFVGGMWEGLEPGAILRRPLAGLPFAATLLSILIAHEAGHYFLSRKLGIAVSLPYFIPFPLPPFGTMGSVIRMQSPIRNRREALMVGAAGPLAGLSLAIPLLVYGLLRSTVQPILQVPGAVMEGNSILYAAVKLALFGRLLPGGGYDVFLHPIAMAAWGGLLVTMLNLIPAGQLDGGHVAYALLGKRARVLNRIVVAATAVLGFVHQAWWLWAVLLLVLGQRSDEPLDDVTRLTPRQRVFAACMLILFLLLFTPKPLS